MAGRFLSLGRETQAYSCWELSQFTPLPADERDEECLRFVREAMKLRHLGAVLVLICLWAIPVKGPAQQYVFYTYRQTEGLKNLSLTSLATDRAGFLWMGTENGVYRFLGNSFERYGAEQGIAELYITDVIADPDGTVWAATAGNLYRREGRRFVPAGRDPIPIAGQQRIAVEDARHLLVVVKGHLYRLEHDGEGRMVSFLPVFSARMVASMPELGRLSRLSLVRAPRNGLRVWVSDGKGFCTWLDSEVGSGVAPRNGVVSEWGRKEGLANDVWMSVVLDRGGTLWAAGLEHVAALPPGAARFVDRSIPGSNPQSESGHGPLIEDREGRTLAPTDGGLARWNGSGWQIIGKTSGLERASSIRGLAFDTAGDLWLASHGSGLYQWAGYAEWEGWSDSQVLPSANIWAIAPISSSRVLLGTERGPARLDPHTGTVDSPYAPRQWRMGQVNAIGPDRDGSWWAATSHGALLRIDPQTGRGVQTAELHLKSNYLLSAFEDSGGRLFLETMEGLYLRDPGKVTPHRVQAVDALLGASTAMTSMCESPGGADWLLAGKHLLRFKDGQWSAPPAKGLPPQSDNLTALWCAGDGALWLVGAQGGVWKLTPRGEALQVWQLELPPGESDLNLLAVLVDRRGWVWLGTDEGLVVWNGRGWRHLTQESGLIWNDVNQGVMREAADGTIWVGTSSGLAHLLHPERVFDFVPLSVSLTDIRRGARDFLGAQQITLPMVGPPLRFQISSPTVRNRSELVFKLRMAGLQSEWMETEDGIAGFSKFAPGQYTFLAMACNPGLDTCSPPVKVGLTILPPWWRSGWFYVVCGVAVVLLVLASGHLYARYLREKSRHLEKLVSERTHELQESTMELEASREQLRIQATHDGLTGMLNRVSILRSLVTEIDRAGREKRTLAVALIDLDYFKRVNDAYGHLAGDDTLRWFAAAVGAAIRPYDHAGRYGGEEFLLVLTEIPRHLAEQRLTKLHAAISNLHVRTRGAEFTVTCSMGAILYDPCEPAGSIESLLNAADQALYAAKAAGRDKMVFRITKLPNPDPGNLAQKLMSSR